MKKTKTYINIEIFDIRKKGNKKILRKRVEIKDIRNNQGRMKSKQKVHIYTYEECKNGKVRAQK